MKHDQDVMEEMVEEEDAFNFSLKQLSMPHRVAALLSLIKSFTN